MDLWPGRRDFEPHRVDADLPAHRPHQPEQAGVKRQPIRRRLMSQPEQFEVLVLGSGFGGKLLAWHMARSGRRTAVVERRWIGGSCPNIACLPSKNEIWSARVAHLAHHA